MDGLTLPPEGGVTAEVEGGGGLAAVVVGLVGPVGEPVPELTVISADPVLKYPSVATIW